MSVARCLTIAGSDSGGGAGIQADLKAFARAGCYGMSAIVALTAQNTVGVTAVQEVAPEFVRAQLDAVFSDIGVDAAKTGMLFSRQIIETVADFLAERPLPLVVDPVMVSTSGAQLLQEDAVEALVTRLFPLATVVTPNLDEAQALGEVDTEDRGVLAEQLHALGAPAVLVTGGHGERPVDHLFTSGRHVEIPVERHDVAATHGAGCTHSATLTALLAQGESLEEAARGAAEAAADAVAHGLVDLGEGEGPVDVLPCRRRSVTSASSGCSPSSSGAAWRRGSPTTPRCWTTGSSSRRTRSSRTSTSLFDRISWRDLGFSAAAVNLSDLAACGAVPDGLLVSLGLPVDTAVASVIELYEGIAETGIDVIGGDTTSADSVYLSVTALGHSERVPGRAGALPGDLLVVTGPLGAAGAAFRRAALRRPPIRLDEGRALAAHAHALIDISDGIARDAAHIAERSRCRLVIDLDHVPLADDATVDDLGFGEDYELLAAVVDSGPFMVIGRCEEGEGTELLLDGRPYELGGWEHFR